MPKQNALMYSNANSREGLLTSPVHHQKMPMKILGIISYTYVIFRAGFWRLWNVLIGVYITLFVKVIMGLL